MNSIVTSVILAIVALASFVTCNIENQSNNLANASIAQRKCNEYAHNACNAPLTASQLKHLDFSSLKLPQDEVASLKRYLKHTYIVGGRTAYEGQFPHMARIGYKNIFIRSLECGGSLISHNYILSAAHCASYKGVFRTHPANWAVLGSYHQNISLDKHNEEFTIINIIIHPDYNDETLEGDIALYKINREVQFNEFIRPICLNTLADINYPILTVSGWGDTRSEGPPSEFLKYVTISFQPDEQCLKLFPAAPAKFNETTMICAGYAPGEKDSCQGDSGGPLVINLLKSCSVPIYVQLGIVSFGKGCGEVDTPAVYTRVSYYVPWIESIVWPQQ